MGREHALGSISLDGLPFQVTANLEIALRHLRLSSPTSGLGTDSECLTDDLGGARVLWIDALCINQHDVEERNHQVQIMSKIFGSARRVLALAWQRQR